MTSFEIVASSTGHSFGVYSGADAASAIAAMLADAGHKGPADADIVATAVCLTARVDDENNAETWWTAARAAKADAPAWMAPLFARATSVTAETAAEAREGRAWAESLPGYADGPAHAREALVWG